MIDVSIIIVNFNSSTLIRNCIDSIKKFSYSCSYEIIVIDNFFSLEEQEKLKQITNIDILILNQENVGFGAANNMGFRSASGGYLFFLNPDTYFTNEALSFFYEKIGLYTDGKTGFLGASLLNPDLSSNHSFGFFSNHDPYRFLKNEIRQNIVKQVVNKKSSNKKVKQAENSSRREAKKNKVDWINGACLFIKKEIFSMIEGFDENFFLFSEEVDLQKRLTDKGFSNYLISGPEIVHTHKIHRKMSNNTRIYFYSGYFVYLSKHYPKKDFYLFKFMFLIILFISLFIDIFSKRYTLKENTLCLKRVYSIKRILGKHI